MTLYCDDMVVVITYFIFHLNISIYIKSNSEVIKIVDAKHIAAGSRNWFDIETVHIFSEMFVRNEFKKMSEN